MSSPETPDFSAMPPREQPPVAEEISHAPARRGRPYAIAGLATALVIGAVGATAFVADHRSGDGISLSSAQAAVGQLPGGGVFGDESGQAPGAQGNGNTGRPGWGHGPGGMGRGGMRGLRGALHGELVVPQPDGTGTQTIVVQSGTVTAVSAKSLSLKSSDGFTATYVITSSTRVLAGSGGISSIKVGATVNVLASKSGSTLTALMVGDRSAMGMMHRDRDGDRPGDGPNGPTQPPAPSSSATSGSSGTA